MRSLIQSPSDRRLFLSLVTSIVVFGGSVVYAEPSDIKDEKGALLLKRVITGQKASQAKLKCGTAQSLLRYQHHSWDTEFEFVMDSEISWDPHSRLIRLNADDPGEITVLGQRRTPRAEPLESHVYAILMNEAIFHFFAYEYKTVRVGGPWRDNITVDIFDTSPSVLGFRWRPPMAPSGIPFTDFIQPGSSRIKDAQEYTIEERGNLIECVRYYADGGKMTVQFSADVDYNVVFCHFEHPNPTAKTTTGMYAWKKVSGVFVLDELRVTTSKAGQPTVRSSLYHYKMKSITLANEFTDRRFDPDVFYPTLGLPLTIDDQIKQTRTQIGAAGARP